MPAPKSLHSDLKNLLIYYLTYKRNLANVTKLRILRWRDYSGWANVITKVLIGERGRLEGQNQRRKYDNGSQGLSDAIAS